LPGFVIYSEKLNIKIEMFWEIGNISKPAIEEKSIKRIIQWSSH
jgi:hypothetical protein